VKTNLTVKAMFIMDCVIILILSVIIFYITNSFWNWNINVPISFSGDTITDGGTLTLAQKAIRGDGILSVKGFWTVDDSNINWTIIDASLHFVIMKILAIFIHVPGKLANVYFVLTFVLGAWFMYYALMRLKINHCVSVCVAMIYTFLPGHLMRGLGHLAIGSSFAMPLMILGCVYILNGELFSDAIDIRDRNKSNQGKAAKFPLNVKIVEGVIGSILIGLSSIYFGVFSMIIHVLVFFVAYLNQSHNKKNAFGAIIFLGTDFLTAFLTVFLPAIVSGGSVIKSFSDSRSRYDIVHYGLKISQLILPIPAHRIGILAKIRALYTGGYTENENALSSLGLLLSLALLFSLILVFVEMPKRKEMLRIKEIGKINILILLIAMVGGICEIIGLLYYSIRCYNRMSFIIACFSAVSLAYILNIIKSKLEPLLGMLIIIILVCFASYDQTSSVSNISKERAAFYAQTWNAEEEFFDLIEAHEKDGSSILVYPSKYSSLYETDESRKYDLMKSYIHTSSIKFSVGYQEGSATERWLQALDQYTSEQKLRIAVGAGFNGILLYKAGFSDDYIFENMLSDFKNILGENNMITSADGDWYYFSFTDYKSILLGHNSDKIKNDCLQLSPDIYPLGMAYQFESRDIDKYLVSGFSGGEKDFRWSLGDTSKMKLKVNAVSYGDIRVKINFLMVYQPQVVSVQINKHDIGAWNVNGEGEIQFDITRQLISDDSIDIVINYSSPTSPASISGSTDTRELAVAYKSIELIDLGTNIRSSSNYIDTGELKAYLNEEK
jgi:phosphoglycerol transferase